MILYRQGEVKLLPTEIPGCARKLDDNKLSIKGSNGQFHEIRGEVYVVETQGYGGKMYILLAVPTIMTHPEYKPKTIPPGSYEVRGTRDYIPENLLPSGGE